MSCNYPGTPTNHNCAVCKAVYKPFESNRAMCYNETTRPENSFLDSVKQVYSLCDTSCKTCENKSTTCKECSDRYYFFEDNHSKCVSTCPNGYSLSPDNTYCISCYETCLKCSSKGNETDNKCTQCKEGYDIDSKGNCIAKCNSKTTYWYVDIAHNNDITCTGGLKCIDNYSFFVPFTFQYVENCTASSTCQDCQNSTLFVYNTQCVLECPKGTKVDAVLHKCTDNVSNQITTVIDSIKANIHSYINELYYTENEAFSIITYSTLIEDKVEQKCKEENLIYFSIANITKRLRQDYMLSDDTAILILKLDLKRDDTVTNQVEYMFFDNKLCINISTCYGLLIAALVLYL